MLIPWLMVLGGGEAVEPAEGEALAMGADL